MGKRVLLIEDEPNIIEALSFILSRDGWTVHTHSNGETAAQRVRSLPPDVVILDVMLPGRSGFDILREIRSDPALQSLPVMMLTARGQARDRDLAAQLGADFFMTKPFSNADMLRNMQALVSADPPGTILPGTILPGAILPGTILPGTVAPVVACAQEKGAAPAVAGDAGPGAEPATADAPDPTKPPPGPR